MIPLSEKQDWFLKWVYLNKLPEKNRHTGMTHRVLRDHEYAACDSKSLNYWGRVYGLEWLEFLKDVKR